MFPLSSDGWNQVDEGWDEAEVAGTESQTPGRVSGSTHGENDVAHFAPPPFMLE
jgi:hypothetical protein